MDDGHHSTPFSITFFLLCVYRAKNLNSSEKTRERTSLKTSEKIFLSNFKYGGDRVQSREARNLFPRFTVLFNSGDK
jgi:hypothetical protein